MAIGAIPKLTHMVIYVKDLAKMERFYTEVMGFIVSDRGGFPDPDAPENIVFLTGTKEEHHEMVLFQNDETNMESQGQQISYLVEDLDQLRDLYHRVQAEGITEIETCTHGNAWSIYFHELEGNRLEIYARTPWYTPQPFKVDIDLEATNEEIRRLTEEMCRAAAGFMLREDREAKIATLLRGKENSRRPA